MPTPFNWWHFFQPYESPPFSSTVPLPGIACVISWSRVASKVYATSIGVRNGSSIHFENFFILLAKAGSDPWPSKVLILASLACFKNPEHNWIWDGKGYLIPAQLIVQAYSRLISDTMQQPMGEPLTSVELVLNLPPLQLL